MLLSAIAAPALCPAKTRGAEAGRLPQTTKVAIDKALRTIRRDFRVPGLVVGVVREGQLVYAEGFGVERLGESKQVGRQTSFHSASISKAITATAVMQLIDAGVLPLDAAVSTRLESFAGTGITVGHLLSHSSGLTDRMARGFWDKPLPQGPDALKRFAARLGKAARRDSGAFSPGNGWHYADANYAVLGALVETIAQQPFGAFVTATVFAPLDMHDSRFGPPKSATAATPHPGRVYVHPSDRHPYRPALAPAAGLQTTVGDLARFAAAHMERDTAILSLPAYEVMHRQRRETDWAGVSQGLGWHIRDGGRSLHHAGGEPGFRALLSLYPEERLGVIVLSNGENTPRWGIRDTVLALLAERQPPELTPSFKVAHPRMVVTLIAMTVAGVAGVAYLALRRRTRRRRSAKTPRPSR